MSFWPSIYNKIYNQIKLVEYRRRFPKDCNYAYMYISKPVKAICAIIYFRKIHSLDDWEIEYASEKDVLTRIKNYKSQYQFGAEIMSIEPIIPITLGELRSNIPNFHAPQSYILVEKNQMLEEYLAKNVVKTGDIIVNDLSNIFPDHICKEY